MPISLITSGLAAAARFTPVAWRRGWGTLALTTIVLGFGLAAPPGLGAAGWFGAALLCGLAARGALWRLALGAGRPGPGGLQLGIVEARLAAVWGLTSLFIAILAALLFVAVLCFAYAAASAGPGFDPDNISSWAPAVDGRGRALVSVVVIAGVGGILYAAARISLAEAASVAKGKVQVLSAWAQTRRRVVVILVGAALLAVPVLASFLTAPGRDAGLAGEAWPWAESVLVAGLWLPASVGFMAYVWQTRAAQ